MWWINDNIIDINNNDNIINVKCVIMNRNM